MVDEITEEELRLAVRRRTVESDPERVGLLASILNEAWLQFRQLSRTGVDSDPRRLQLMLLAQSLNVAQCSLNLLRDGYPRMALHFARIMWEGHIAFRWSSNNGEAVQRHFEDFREEKHWPRGSWPPIGDMAKHFPDQFDSEGYQQLHSNYRRTPNELFSHAVSIGLWRPSWEATMRASGVRLWDRRSMPTWCRQHLITSCRYSCGSLSILVSSLPRCSAPPNGRARWTPCSTPRKYG